MRNLHQLSGHISDKRLADTIKANAIEGIDDVTPADIKLSHKILGPCPACYDGKVKDNKQVYDCIENDTVGKTVCVDISYFPRFKPPFLLSIDA